MYRENAAEKAPPAPSGELLFTPKAAQEDAEKAWFAGAGLVALPLVSGLALGAALAPWAGWVGFGGGTIAALAARKLRSGPTVLRVADRSLVVGQVRGTEVLSPLMKEFVAHMEATEWLSKVRVFLRKHGWVPEDEREDHVPDSAVPASEIPDGEIPDSDIPESA